MGEGDWGEEVMGKGEGAEEVMGKGEWGEEVMGEGQGPGPWRRGGDDHGGVPRF